MNSLKERIEASAREVTEKAEEVIRAAQEFYKEGHLPTRIMTEAIRMCEDGLPYAAEQTILQSISAQMYEDIHSDMPDPTIPFTFY